MIRGVFPKDKRGFLGVIGHFLRKEGCAHATVMYFVDCIFSFV